MARPSVCAQEVRVIGSIVVALIIALPLSAALHAAFQDD
jgi:hypothetical protein